MKKIGVLEAKMVDGLGIYKNPDLIREQLKSYVFNNAPDLISAINKCADECTDNAPVLCRTDRARYLELIKDCLYKDDLQYCWDTFSFL